MSESLAMINELEESITSRDLDKANEILRKISHADISEMNKRGFFFDAIISGSSELVSLLVDLGMDIDYRDNDDWTPLMFATLQNNLSLVKIFVDSGANVNYISCEGEFALYIAAYKGFTEIYNYLFSLTFDNLRSEASKYLSNKQTPSSEDSEELLQLIFAASKGRSSYIEDLIDSGVEVNVYSSDGMTPLRTAIIGNHSSLVHLLLERGANPDFGLDQSPLMDASGSCNVSLVKLLIEFGANVNVMIGGRTALHFATQYSNEEIVTLIIEAGGDLYREDINGYTPLMRLALSPYHSNGSIVDMLEVFRKFGVSYEEIQKFQIISSAACNDLSKIDFMNASFDLLCSKNNRLAPLSLILASERGSISYVRKMLSKNINLDYQDAQGNTALTKASEYGKLSTVRALLEADANVYLTNKLGYTALDCVERIIEANMAGPNHPKILKVLQEKMRLDAGKG